MITSEAERTYIIDGVKAGIRSDGRGCLDFRPLQLELSLVLQANGSARLLLGETDVLVGVKAELGSPSPHHPDQGQVQVTVECSSVASPEYEGRGGEEWASALSRTLQETLAGGAHGGYGLDLCSLCLLPGRTCWRVYVDGLILNDGGNVLDALSLATLAALGSTRLPRVEVMAGEEDEEPQVELDDDLNNMQPLVVDQVPLIITLNMVGPRLVVDLTSEEELCASTSLQVAVTRTGRLCGMGQQGPRGLPLTGVSEVVEVAQKVGPKLWQDIERFVRCPPS